MNTSDYIKLYTDFLKNHISIAKPMKVVCDSSNGSAGMIITALQDLKIPNLELISINDTPDPEFSAHGPNPLNPGATDEASKKVLEKQADFGVIFDADGDRAFFVDNTGKTLDSFMIAFLLFKKHQPPFVADETVFKSLEHMKVFSSSELIPSKVGTRFVKEVLRGVKGSVAAEFSGHYYFKDFFNTDSGIFTMISVFDIVSRLDMKLSEYIATLPQQFVHNDDIKLTGNVTWKNLEPKVHAFANSIHAMIETREGITLDTGSTWVNMRPSNTEPLVRLIGGGSDKEEVVKLTQAIQKLV